VLAVFRGLLHPLLDRAAVAGHDLASKRCRSQEAQLAGIEEAPARSPPRARRPSESGCSSSASRRPRCRRLG
jgi:hypothetical protein